MLNNKNHKVKILFENGSIVEIDQENVEVVRSNINNEILEIRHKTGKNKILYIKLEKILMIWE